MLGTLYIIQTVLLLSFKAMKKKLWFGVIIVKQYQL